MRAAGAGPWHGLVLCVQCARTTPGPVGGRLVLSATRTFFVGAIGAFASCGIAAAQSTGGVTGPKIAPNDRAVEFRIAYDPDSGRFAQRLHYQQAVSRDWRLRAIVVQDFRDGDFRFRNVTLQAHYQFQRAARGWNAGLQFQGVIPTGNRGPGQARLAWANSLDIAGGGEFRFAAYAARPIGDAAPPGIFLETRTEASFPTGHGTRLGVLSFNEWGSTAGFGALAEQSHRVGPLVRWSGEGGLGLEASVQLGLTRDAPDNVLRLFVTKRF